MTDRIPFDLKPGAINYVRLEPGMILYDRELDVEQRVKEDGTLEFIHRRPGMKYVAELPPAASVCFSGGKLIIASPDAPPRILEL